MKVVIVHNPLNGMVLCVKGSSGGQGVFPVFDQDKAPFIVIQGKFRAAGYVVGETHNTLFTDNGVTYISCHVVGTVKPQDPLWVLELKAPQDVLELLGDDIPEQVEKHLQQFVRPWQKKTA